MVKRLNFEAFNTTPQDIFVNCFEIFTDRQIDKE